jgi:UPF0271 protein
MDEAVRRALVHGVALGAHPGYPDRDGFGRAPMALRGEALTDTIARQIDALAHIASKRGATLSHVKAHGALYNEAARDHDVASAIAEGALRVDRHLVLFGLAGSSAIDVWRDRGLSVAAEGFCDRAYTPDGTLVPRADAGALITDPQAAAAQAVLLASAGRCRTLCVHSDTPGAERVLRAVRDALEHGGWRVSSETLRG